MWEWILTRFQTTNVIGSSGSNIFSSLPKYVLFPIFIEWTSIHELCRLDTSLCNRKMRKIFLNYIENSSSIGFKGIHTKYNQLSYLNWIMEKRIAVTELIVDFHLTAASIKALGVAQDAAYLNKLRTLCLANVHESTLSQATVMCRDLHKLTLCYWTLLATNDIFEMQIMPNNPNLTQIFLQHCSFFSLNAMKSALKLGKSLRKISFVEREAPLPFCNVYTAFKPLEMNCVDLVSLSLYQYEQGNNDFIIRLAEKCKQLRYVTLLRLNVTDKGVVALAENCLDLVSFALEPFYQNTDVTDLSIKALSNYSHHIQYININAKSSRTVPSCVFSSTALNALADCKALQYLCCNCDSLPLETLLWYKEKQVTFKIEKFRHLSGMFDPYPECY